MATSRGSISIGLAVLVVVAAGCTTGPMDVREVRYWAVANGEDTNYYRMRVSGATRLGVAGYKSGWFPARAVDRLFGDVSSEGGVAELQVRSELEAQIAQKIKETQGAWLNAAADPNADEGLLRKLMEARRRVLAYPASTVVPYPGAIEVEYNPGVGVATRYADEKLVFVLASNPDEIIASLARFVEEDKTTLTINRMAGLLTQRAAAEVAAKKGTLEVDKASDPRMRASLGSAREKLAAGTTKPAALEAVDVLLTIVDLHLP
jgi:hypothetical protein